jgi:FAD/FMN-containing dehydrogenase
MYALIEHASLDPDDGGHPFSHALTDALESGALRDAIIAQSLAEARALWAIREATAEFPLRLEPVNFDVSLPIGDIGRFADACRARFEQRWPGHVSYYFGHIGDSNLHVTVDGRSVPGVAHETIDGELYALLAPYGGSVSAEHGIGVLKRAFLPVSRSPAELAAMQAIKRALDPRAILNPGKLLPTP